MKMTCKPRWSLGNSPALASVQQEVDQLFDQFFPGYRNGETAHWAAPVTLWEENNSFFVEIDLPGVKLEEVDVTLEDNTLRIKAERKLPTGERKYWHQERSFGKVQRVITLPDVVDPESIEAELREGVLSLKLTKRPEAQPRKINVKS